VHRLATRQGVTKSEEISNLQVTHVHLRLCVIEFNFYAVIGDAYSPKQAAWGDTGVEVVDLIRRGQRPLIEIQSDEAEGGSMLFPIHSNVNSLHETLVYVEKQMSFGTSMSICSSAGPLNGCDTDKAVKIGDGRRLVAMSGQEDMETRRDAARNGFRRNLSASAGMRNCGYPESSAESGPGSDGRCSNELAARQHGPFPKVGVTCGMLVAVRLAFYWQVSRWNDQWFLLSSAESKHIVMIGDAGERSPLTGRGASPLFSTYPKRLVDYALMQDTEKNGRRDDESGRFHWLLPAAQVARQGRR